MLGPVFFMLWTLEYTCVMVFLGSGGVPFSHAAELVAPYLSGKSKDAFVAVTSNQMINYSLAGNVYRDGLKYKLS